MTGLAHGRSTILSKTFHTYTRIQSKHSSHNPHSHSKDNHRPHHKPNPAFMPTTDGEVEERYVLTLYTNPELHEQVTALRTKYFPKHLNKLAAHMTLFHALPESRLGSDVIPLIESTAENTSQFVIRAGPPFEMNKGIGIAVQKAHGGNEARDIHEKLLATWKKEGFLSEQDSRHSGVHYTIMNKVDDPKKVTEALQEVRTNWKDIPGTVVGLALWHYERGKVAESVLAPRSAPWENGVDRPGTLTRTLTPEAPPLHKSRTLTGLRSLFRSTSATNVGGGRNMASTAMPTQAPTMHQEEQVMDTRTPSPLPKAAGGNQPDMSEEVAMLSTKLINAINFQTTLDDQLQQTRHDLEMSQRQFEKLQAEKKYLDDMIQDRVLVRRSDVDPVIQSLRAELATEKAAREAAEGIRKQTEAELENLTSALFQEANEMVAAARKDTEAAEKRNSQLKSQLGDTEVLLASQQEQLQDLKLTMEKMSERGDNDTVRDSVPSTPIHPPAGLFEGLPMSPNLGSTAQEFAPEHPLFFSQLLSPVLRNDVAAFQDFQDLLQAARKAVGHMRSSSSGTTASTSNTSAALGQHHSGSSPNLPGAFSFSSSSPHNSGTFSSPMVPLKDTRFYKRTLMEDIEPALRLDQAPGLSFLSRRSVMSALLQGSLVVEPFMPGSKFYGPVYSCALCGEGRKSEPYIRRHRFRTSEEESAQRYPLCDYCLGRIRASGDFMTFLRMVRDGHWRADSEDEQKTAWEESVRLRERMFWARIGGGVVPSVSHRNATPPTAAIKSARNSIEVPGAAQKIAVHSPVPDDVQSQDKDDQSEVRRPSLDQKLVEVFKRHRKSMSLGNAMMDFSPTGERLVRSPTLESIKQEPVRSGNIDKPPLHITTPTVKVASDEPSTVASIPREEPLHVAVDVKANGHQQNSYKLAEPSTSETVTDEGSTSNAVGSSEADTIPATSADESVSQQSIPEILPTIKAETDAPESSEAEIITKPSELAIVEPAQSAEAIPSQATLTAAASSADLASTSPGAGSDIPSTTDISKDTPIATHADATQSTVSTDEAKLPTNTIDEAKDATDNAIQSTDTADEVSIATEVTPPPAEKKPSPSPTPPNPSKTPPLRPGGKAVRKKSSNASIKSKKGSSPRPSLANSKKSSSEPKADKGAQDKKPAGGVLARVRAMESQAASKPAGGKTA